MLQREVTVMRVQTFQRETEEKGLETEYAALCQGPRRIVQILYIYSILPKSCASGIAIMLRLHSSVEGLLRLVHEACNQLGVL